MDNIRVTYSGLIAFAVSLIGVVTGAIFVIIVTRQLEPEEFAIWSILGTMLSYVAISQSAVSYWTLRQVARDEAVAKTSVISSGMLSLGVLPLYFALVTVYSGVAPEFYFSMVLSMLLIPASFVNGALQAINRGYQPHKVSYSILAFEGTKIPLGLVLVYLLDLGIDGTIVTVVLAYIGQIIIQMIFARKRLVKRFNPAFLYRWIRLSWIPIYSGLGGNIWSSGIVIFPLITGSVVGVAYFAAAMVISEIPAHAKMVSQAVYPKLLASKNHKYVAENLTKQFFFLLPLTGIAIVFAKPALFILNSAYQEAYLAVIFLTFYRFTTALIFTANDILTGLEKVDVEQNPGFRKMLRSKLFMVPTLLIVNNSLYIAILVVILLLLGGGAEIQLVTIWSLLPAVVSVPFVAYLWILVRRTIRIPLPKRRILVYAASTLAFMAVYYVTADHVITYPENIFEHVLQMVLQLALCAGVYFAITYAADHKTRHLVRQVIAELRAVAARRE